MQYLSNFECFVVSTKLRYEKITRRDFLEDFGTVSLVDLKRYYDQGASQDQAVSEFMRKNPKLVDPVYEQDFVS
jgi:hypothetical protein